MPEWSKGFDSSSNIVRCVGSNPTARMLNDVSQIGIVVR